MQQPASHSGSDEELAVSQQESPGSVVELSQRETGLTSGPAASHGGHRARETRE